MSHNGNKPRTRQRLAKPPPALDVPDIDQDAAERKRVLNVLAQRRYRERKRQDRLKARTNKAGGADACLDQHAAAGSSHSTPPEGVVISPPQPSTSTEGGTSLLDLDLNWAAVDDGSLASLLPETTATLVPSDLSVTQQPVNSTGDDLFPQPMRNATLPASGPLSMFMATNTFPPSFGIDSPPSLTDDQQPSSSSDPETSSQTSFPDSYLLPVHELTLLKAFLRISSRIGVNDTNVWSLDCISPFALGGGTPACELPPTWRPTNAQLSMPHHPVFDFMPWPEARSRIIMILSLPDEQRPPSARGPLAMVNFVYDFEDSAEGVRIYGHDPYDPGSWEIGQALFERWWFIFDRSIVDNSNRWREIRGAPPLLLKGS